MRHHGQRTERFGVELGPASWLAPWSSVSAKLKRTSEVKVAGGYLGLRFLQYRVLCMSLALICA